jgi:hypothetical protein
MITPSRIVTSTPDYMKVFEGDETAEGIKISLSSWSPEGSGYPALLPIIQDASRDLYVAEIEASSISF